VPQGSVLGPLLFLAYVNDIWENMESTVRLFADDCVIYRKIMSQGDMKKLQDDLDRLGVWATENGMKINPGKSKAIRFTKTRANDTLSYSLMGKEIPQTSSCKYLGIILRSDLSWVDQVNYTVKKAWKALHFTMRTLKKGNSNTKSLAYRSLVRPILEYGAACWDPYREGQVRALDRVQKRAAKFALNTSRPNWETLASRRKLSRVCALYKAYSGERAWKTIGDRLQRPHYWSRVDHKRKIRTRGQRTDIGKYSFVNRTIQDWNQLPGAVFEQLPSKQMAFKKRARKEIFEYH
jgi:ribonucleases P/MRP protein subunit RPP40